VLNDDNTPEQDVDPESLFSMALDDEGYVRITMPRDVFFAAESFVDDGVIHLYLSEKQGEELGRAHTRYIVSLFVDRAEKALRTLPRESVRRDLGRAGVKLLKRFQGSYGRKQQMDAHVAHAKAVFAQYGLGGKG
jgi:hypothetical protein